jgi:hypothetical protein
MRRGIKPAINNELNMKTHFKFASALLLLSTLNPCLSTASVATTIDPVNKYVWGANVGWMDWRGDSVNGAVIGDYVCSGYIYAANVGWLNLGSGSPTNGIHYQNLSASDFGVNQDGLGNLRGYAYGANIGWVLFENSGAPKVDLRTGRFTGHAYSANCGWISLSNASAYVQTDSIDPGTLAPDGLPIAWLLIYFGTTNVNANADADGDGMSNRQEYLAGTDPANPNDKLQITGFSTAPGGTFATLTWQSAPTRFYFIQKTLAFNPSIWVDSGLGLLSPDGASTTRSFSDTNAPSRYYRVRAVRPLSP